MRQRVPQQAIADARSFVSWDDYLSDDAMPAGHSPDGDTIEAESWEVDPREAARRLEAELGPIPEPELFTFGDEEPAAAYDERDDDTPAWRNLR